MTNTLAQRIQEADSRLAEQVAQAYTNLVYAMGDIRNRVTLYDYGQALWTFMDRVDGGVPELDPFIRNAPVPARTPADDRPLYLRLAEEGPRVSDVLTRSLLALNLIQAMLQGNHQAESDELFDAWKAFNTALGVPTNEELTNNPELYPGVQDGHEFVANNPVLSQWFTTEDAPTGEQAA